MLATQANLELVASRGARDMSLLAALDRTVTPMGGRKLRSVDFAAAARLAGTATAPANDRGFVAGSRSARVACASALKSCAIWSARSAGLSQASGNARDLVALRMSLEQIPALKRELQKLIERLGFGNR